MEVRGNGGGVKVFFSAWAAFRPVFEQGDYICLLFGQCRGKRQVVNYSGGREYHGHATWGFTGAERGRRRRFGAVVEGFFVFLDSFYEKNTSYQLVFDENATS